MAVVNISYQTIGTAVAITSADSLADTSWASSANVDNQTNLYVDALVGGSLQTGTQSGGTIDFYVAASWDGVEYTAGLDATDNGITWGTTPAASHVDGYLDLFYLASVSTNATDDNKDVKFGPFSVAQACGGTMPLEWCIVIQNNTGAALNATGTNNHLEYTGIEYTSV